VDWVAIVNQVGLPIALSAALLYGAWWSLRKVVSWVEVIAPSLQRAVDKHVELTESLDLNMTRQTEILEEIRQHDPDRFATDKTNRALYHASHAIERIGQADVAEHCRKMRDELSP